jgi:hypothetical protein
VVTSLRPSNARILITQRPSEWREQVESRLAEICKLPVGWDGYQAGPVDFRTAHFALNLLNSVCGPDAPAPGIVPGANGDLQIEWHVADRDIELHVKAPYDVHAWHCIVGSDPDGEERSLTIDFTEVARWIKDIPEPACAVVPAAA